MDRRRFLHTLLSSSACLALGATALRSAPAFAGDPARFAQGLQEHPWLLGWRGVTSESLGPATVQLQAGCRPASPERCTAMARPGPSAMASATTTGSTATAWCMAGASTAMAA